MYENIKYLFQKKYIFSYSINLFIINIKKKYIIENMNAIKQLQVLYYNNLYIENKSNLYYLQTIFKIIFNKSITQRKCLKLYTVLKLEIIDKFLSVLQTDEFKNLYKHNIEQNNTENKSLNDWIFCLLTNVNQEILKLYDLDFVLKYYLEKEKQKKFDLYLLYKVLSQIIYLPHVKSEDARDIIHQLDLILSTNEDDYDYYNGELHEMDISLIDYAKMKYGLKDKK